MMPVIFTVLGLCIGLKFGKALMSGLKVGVGFIGLSIVTALLTSALGPALNTVVDIYDLQLRVFDMGWPAAAAVAYNTAVGAFIIPVCLGVNLLMLVTKTTRTVNIDLWNYWHFAFIGAVIYFACDSLAWGFFGAIICYIITLILADITAKRFQGFYEGMDGISIPQPFCAGFMPFAWAINKGLDAIPGMSRLEIDAEGLKRKFGILGEPLFLGVIVGVGIGCLTCTSWAGIVDNIPYILGLGITLAGMFYVFPLVLPYTRGNVVKTFITGLVIIVLGLYMVTNIAPWFTKAAQDVFAATGDSTVAIPDGFEGGSLDFASSPLAWIIFQCTHGLKYIGAALLVISTMAMMWWNRVHILRNQRAMIAANSDEIQETE